MDFVATLLDGKKTTSNTQETVVKFTTNYEQFKRLKGNRPIIESHVKRIMKAMQSNFAPPIIEVDEEMRQLDGQHRLEACRRLGLPVGYVVRYGKGLDYVRSCNANQKSWSGEHYLKGFCEAGYEDYVKFAHFVAEYKEFNFSDKMEIAVKDRNNSNLYEAFKDGSFQFTNENAQAFCDSLRLLDRWSIRYTDRSFVRAMLRCFRNPNFKFDHFLGKMERQSTKMVLCPNTEMYLKLIQDIYNYKTLRKDRIQLV